MDGRAGFNVPFLLLLDRAKEPVGRAYLWVYRGVYGVHPYNCTPFG
jgi:hypothetical protein